MPAAARRHDRPLAWRLDPRDARWLGIFLVLLGVVTARAATPEAQITLVTLRPAVRLPADGPLTLGAAAEIAGPEAEALSGLVLAERAGALPAASDGWRRLAAHRVRERLESTPGLHMGRIALRGGEVLVGVLGDPLVRTARDADARTRPALDGPGEVRVHPRLRRLIEQRVAGLLGAAPQDLRLTFEHADAEALAMDPAGLVVDIQPTGMSDRLPLKIRTYEGDLARERASIRVGVEVRRTVAVTRREIRRAEPVGPDDLAVEQRWTPPSVQPAGVDALVGSVARRTLRAGEILAPADVARPLAAKRGELVTVESIVGGIKVTTTARARADGRVGETIEFEAVGGAGGRFTARLNGERYAIMAERRPGAGEDAE